MNNQISKSASLEASHIDESNYVLRPFSRQNFVSDTKEIYGVKEIARQQQPSVLNDLLLRLSAAESKKSFLVYSHNKYFTVPTESIAFFFVKHENSIIKCFDGKEYAVNHSLDHIQDLISDKQFFRLNRQYLINFKAIKEAEHYFARKLFVRLVVAAPDQLLVSKEKASAFLDWLENR